MDCLSVGLHEGFLSVLMVKGSSTWNRERRHSKTNHLKRRTGLVFCNPKDYEAISERQLDNTICQFHKLNPYKIIGKFFGKCKDSDGYETKVV